MYLYSLNGYEENTVLTHEKQFTKREFKKMCMQAPILESDDYKFYDSIEITKYLINEFGFLPVKYTASFFVDNEVK